ncbi:uncharacterized protein TRUGW13939_06256 [Talaromyces rugulosus]|uniref:Cytochrome P450 n=1 Tax=Talaromyces rugulosus TaxID=121627 RepID=A0A7H8R088_TALRU|nr:uncharacterized protein TRUGW13939_06256 [Talaromyces rugulosus]QKX59125.1 hypothetical protein TRUGW13939_06256 [Talaromyces rugulosus]
MAGIVVAAVLLFYVLSVWAFISRSPVRLPPAGSRWPILNRLESLTKGKAILYRVYQKQLSDNKPYLLRGIFGDSIVLPPSMLEWLVSQPESHLSAKSAQMDALNIPLTFLRAEIGLNPVHEPLIRRNLTAHLDQITSHIWDEVGLVLEELWGQDTEVWREVNLDYTIRHVVARASNRVFVGGELCRNNDYIESSLRYVSRVSACGLLLNFFPSWLRHYLGVLFQIPIRVAYSQCSKHLLPIFSELTGSEAASCTHLFSSWLVNNSKKYPLSSLERTPDYLSRRIMALNFASIHTTTLTTCNLLLDIFSDRTTASLLRDESLVSSASWNTTWNRGRLNQMLRLDSALRESLRLWGLVAKAMSRKVMQPAGIILPSGQRLLQGTTVCVSGWGLHHDENVHQQPFEFIHDRFMRRSTHGASPSQEETEMGTSAGHAAAETDVNFAAWGIGKHACPGRFFAVDLIKIILIHVLVDYEVELLGERPENMWIEYNVIPPPATTVSIRRRKLSV